MPVVKHPDDHGDGTGDGRVGEGIGGQAVGGVCAAALKPNQPNHQEAGTHGDQRQVVGYGRFAGLHVVTPSEENDRGKRRKTGADVDHDTARKVHYADLGEEAAAPNPVADGNVDEDHPQDEELQVAAEVQPPGERARDQRRSDDGKHKLVSKEQDERHSARIDGARSDPHLIQREVVADVAEQAAHIRPESEAEPAENPDDGRNAHGNEVLHHDGQHVLFADHAAVEQRKGGRHHAHQRGAEHNKTCIARVEGKHMATPC